MRRDELLLQLDNEVKRVLATESANTIPYHYSENLPKKAKMVLDDIEKNHNTSWAMFMYDRNKKSKAMNKYADKYRGNKTTYGDLYARAFEYSKSLKAICNKSLYVKFTIFSHIDNNLVIKFPSTLFSFSPKNN